MPQIWASHKVEHPSLIYLVINFGFHLQKLDEGLAKAYKRSVIGRGLLRASPHL